MVSELQEAISEYRTFLAHGGSRGSHAGRVLRERIGKLVGQEKERQARELRITEADILREAQKVGVFD